MSQKILHCSSLHCLKLVIKLNLKSAYLQGKVRTSKVHSFKEFNKNCITQVFSDTIQKCILSNITQLKCEYVAQGFSVLLSILNPYWPNFSDDNQMYHHWRPIRLRGYNYLLWKNSHFILDVFYLTFVFLTIQKF